MIIIQACRGRDLNFEGTTLAMGTSSEVETAWEQFYELAFLYNIRSGVLPAMQVLHSTREFCTIHHF